MTHQTTDATPADLASCRALLRNGSRTFYAASFLLPSDVRDAATALYAFCRLADDAVDGDGDAAAGLAGLQDRLDRAYAGRPAAFAADRAFAATVHRYAIPKTLPAALLEGFAWDAEGRQYEDIDGLRDYAARVAGVVGAMMAMLMGVRAHDVVARACDLGVAMQLTNIARDVGEDARAGRLYLPRDWMREAGIDPDRWLANPVFSPALASVIRRLVREADTLYKRSVSGIAALPAPCRPGIYAARLLYAEIGHELDRSGLDSVTRRAVVPLSRKLQLVSRAWATASRLKPGLSIQPLTATRFLVDAAAAAPAMQPARQRLRAGWWDLHGGAVTVIELFERLERREKMGLQPSRPPANLPYRVEA